jgi:hypothetical protein
MLPKTGKTVRKPLSRGQRKQVRRMKQEARKGSVIETKAKKKVIPTPAAPKE